MSAQDNLERALTNTTLTRRQIERLAEPDAPPLKEIPTRTLRAMAHDLDSISMALREEANTRPESNEPQDWG